MIKEKKTQNNKNISVLYSIEMINYLNQVFDLTLKASSKMY